MRLTLAILVTLAALIAPHSASATLTPAPGWPIESNQNNQRLGIQMAAAGDVNGDGYGDVLIVGGEVILPANGSVRLYLGTPTGLSTTPIWMKKGLGIFPRVAGAGDVNGDGFADIIVGSPSSGGGGFVVYYGRSWGIDTVNTTVISAGFDKVGFGGTVSTAGDVNGDGFDDVIVGAANASGPCGTNAGGVEVFYGSASGLQSAGSTYIEGCSVGLPAGAELGWSVGTAGDVNGDGYADVVAGAPWQGNGYLYVWYGSASGIQSPTTVFTKITGDEANDHFGWSSQTAGDINGDGYADVIVGAPLHDYGGSDPDRGHTYVYLGGPSGLSTTSFWDEVTPGGFPNPGQCGYSVATAGDINGDGLADILMGFPQHSNGQSNEGGFACFVSTKTYLSSIPSLPYVESNEADAQMGWVVASAGDVNGDGFGDVLVSAPYHDGGQVDEGQVFLYLGGPDPMTQTPWMNTGPSTNWKASWSVASAGDVNGDQYDDFISGDPFGTNTLTNEGRVQLWYGGPGGPDHVVDWQIFGGQASGQLGVSVARAGDVNGDGYGDVIVGADQYNSTGAAWIYYGSPTGPGGSTIPPTALYGPSIGSHFGGCVASAGDVNGDGYGDVIVSAAYDDTPALDAGRAFVYLGGPLGLDPTPRTILGPVGLQLAGAHFGASVGCAGDFNGDGYDDVIVGEPDRNYQPDIDSGVTPAAGQFGVYLGGPSGVQTSAWVGFTSATANARMGASVASAGDVNNDGYADVIVGTPGMNSATGEVDIWGGGTGTNPPGLFFHLGSQPSSAYGSSVGSAGDINGDGLSDIVVGAVFEDNGGAIDAGAVYVYKSPLTNGMAPTEKFLSDNAFDNLGHVVAGAMDLNGDGYDDVASGAPGDDVGGISNAGSARIWFGNGGIALDRRVFQINGGFTHFIAPLGGNDNSGRVYIAMTGRNPGGRSHVAMDYDASPAQGSSGPSFVGRTPFSLTGTPGALGSSTSLVQALNGLPANARYRWRVRTHSTSPYFQNSTWTTFARNGTKEADFRTTAPPGVAVEPSAGTVEFALDAPMPNPASGPSSIQFSLPHAGRVSLGIYDVQGRQVRSLVNGERQAGRQTATWDGRDASGHTTAAGVYFYRLSTGGKELSRRLVWLR